MNPGNTSWYDREWKSKKLESWEIKGFFVDDIGKVWSDAVSDEVGLGSEIVVLEKYRGQIGTR